MLAAMTDKTLAVIYQLLMDLAYVIFTAAIALTVAYDSNFASDFQNYIQEESNRGLIVALVVIGVIILAANKVHTDLNSPHTSPTARKYVNLIEDILRSIVYILLLILVTPFAFSHYTVNLLMASYILYIVAGALFLAVKLIKWIYFLCCGGKNTESPWILPGDTLDSPVLMLVSTTNNNDQNSATNLVKK
jgi:predicted RNase H-related nuclease YkuK (DUF458 family)